MDSLFEKILQALVISIFDCIEDVVGTLTLVAGKRTLRVFLICFVSLVISVICKLLGLFTFISWQEALIACAVMGVISAINYKNELHIDNIKKVIRRQ